MAHLQGLRQPLRVVRARLDVVAQRVALGCHLCACACACVCVCAFVCVYVCV